MGFNFLTWIAEQPPRTNKSAPTDVRIILLNRIITSFLGLRKGAVMKLPLGRYLALLKTYLKPQWRSTLLLGICLVTGIGLQLLNPQILRYFIDTAGSAAKEG